jgi:hypothetical protein
MFQKGTVKTLILMLSLLIGVSLSAFGKVLFEDDFEADSLNKEPSLWGNIVAGFTLRVVADPDNPNNKILAEQGEGNGLGIPTPADWEKQDFWVDYIWEFDWMWDRDEYQGTAHRYQGPLQYLHSSRRLGGANFIIYMWNGNWNELQNKPWPSEPNVWYRMQISDIGDEHIVKGKERDDDAEFEALNPIVSIKDNTYKTGTIGLFGTSGGALYWDNIIVYEPGTNIQAVTPAGKLTTTWGTLKAR